MCMLMKGMRFPSASQHTCWGEPTDTTGSGMTLPDVTHIAGRCASYSSHTKCSTGTDGTSLCVYLGLPLRSSAHGGFGSPALKHCLLWAWWKLICGVDVEKEETQEETRNNSSLPFVKLVMILLHWLRPLKASWLCHTDCVIFLCHTGLGQYWLLNTLLGRDSKAAH